MTDSKFIYLTWDLTPCHPIPVLIPEPYSQEVYSDKKSRLKITVWSHQQTGIIAFMGMDEVSERENMQKGEQMTKNESWGLTEKSTTGNGVEFQPVRVNGSANRLNG